MVTGGYSAKTAYARVADWIAYAGPRGARDLNHDIRTLPVADFNVKYGSNFGARAKNPAGAEASFRGQLRKIYAPLLRSRGGKNSRGYNRWGKFIQLAHNHRHPRKPKRGTWKKMIEHPYPPCAGRNSEYLWDKTAHRVHARNRGRLRLRATRRAWVGSFIKVSYTPESEAGVTLEDFRELVFGRSRDPRYDFRAWTRDIQRYFRVARMYHSDFSRILPFFISFNIYLRRGTHAPMYRIPWDLSLKSLQSAIEHMIDVEKRKFDIKKRGKKRGNTPVEETLVMCIKPVIALIANHRFVYRRPDVGKRHGVFIAWY